MINTIVIDGNNHSDQRWAMYQTAIIFVQCFAKCRCILIQIASQFTKQTVDGIDIEKDF